MPADGRPTYFIPELPAGGFYDLAPGRVVMMRPETVDRVQFFDVTIPVLILPGLPADMVCITDGHNYAAAKMDLDHFTGGK